MKKLLLWLFAFFLFAHNIQAQCGPGQDTTPPVFGGGGDGTMSNPFRNLLQSTVGSVPSGTYYFNFNGSTFQGELDNDTDGGGWLMILNYVHVAGDNSDLTVRNTDLPLLGSSTLGDNEAGTINWGHMGNAMAAAIDFEEIRFYGVTTGHNRVIDFKTNYSSVLNYVKTGTGSFDGIEGSNFTALPSHIANIPAQAVNEFTNQGDLALTEFPFWRGGLYHWGIRGGGNRWEVDDFAINAASTIHRVWVRGDLSPVGNTEITAQLDATGTITIAPTDFEPNAIDNCGNVNYSLSQTDFDCSHIGNNTTQLIATDDAGNQTSKDVVVVIEDTTAPTISIGAYGTGTVSDPFTSLLPQVVNSYPSGRYYFTFEGNTFQAELDNDTSGGGWLMVLNYVHQGGTNPTLQVRSTDVPLLNSSALGDDESGTENWGHFSNSLAAAIDFTHLRFYGETSAHSRVIHFETNSGLYTTLPRGIRYVKSGIGRFEPFVGNSTLYNDHSGNLPFVASQYNQNQGDYALTSSPFRWPAGFYQWNVGGSWDVDDRAGDVNNTIHRVWVKGDLSPTTKTPQSLVFELDPVMNTVSLTPTDLAITATDNCGVQNLTLSQTNFDCSHVGDNTLTITATDINGNIRTADITITIKDPVPPVVQCVAPFTLQLDEFGKASITVDDISAGYSDNCNVIAAIDITEFDCTHIGDNIVTLTVTDDSGNVTTCSTTVTVDVSCPSDIIVDNDPNSCGAVVDYAGCGTLISGLASGSLFPIGTTNTILEITKADGTISQCSFSVTVNDTQAPLFITKDHTMTLGAGETAMIVANDLIGAHPMAPDYTLDISGAIDRVDISAIGTEVILDDDDLSTGLPIGFEFGFYGNRYTEFYISSNGFITFSDEGENGCCSGQTLPDSNTPNNLIAFDWTDINPTNGGTIRYTTIGTSPNRIAIIDFDAVHYYDTTPDATTTQIKLFESTNRIEIHGTSTLDAGNDKTQGLENIDGTAAIIVPGRNSAVWSTTNDVVAFVPVTGILENCGIDTIVTTPTTFDCSHKGVNNVTVTVTDIHGNSFAQTAQVTVETSDTTAPVITLLGITPQTIELGTGYTELDATTDDGSAIVIDSSDFIDAVGSYTIRYNATDDSCNDAIEVTRTVNVVDTTPPMITLLGDNPQVIELGSGYIELGATTDDGSVVVIDSSDFIDMVGSYIIRYNATDVNGNNAVEITRTVNVVDTTPPMITLLGDNPQVIELGSGYIELGATTDDGSVVVIDSSDFMDMVGSYTIRYNATDASGNTATEVARVVQVVDTTAPVITLNGENPQIIGLGEGYTELGATTDDASVVVIDASAVNTNTLGSYNVTYNAIDASGNNAIEVIRIINVIERCPLETLPFDNFQVQALSETCTDKNNGYITINTIESQNYIATINNETYTFISNLTVNDLSPGTYPVCIAIDGFTDCEQCFELVIEAAAVLNGKTTNINSTTSQVLVEIESGTAPYTVTINEEIIGEYNTSSFTIPVKRGDVIEVVSSLACEGKLSKTIEGLKETSVYPNPTKANVTVTLPGIDNDTIAINIHNTLGIKVSSKVYPVSGGKVVLPMEHLATGIYFININDGTSKVYKIIKE
ncbi:immunoglobulin-like domain-containing protein [Aquimarina sp. 2201CG5-10]|uniref:immunoglobulin-like domain-containing protein n=1 Tax=Aquimarina callyspongiae TaxID=3098150 RepID=UPI002AB42205|nr:immunoglobulin-like domain-containing protein [Aquimarina sp. 2201CG5-10]MDY8134886.1 DUF5011 domain-containing protein [Aquimarina sp. 2201CG5-10]